MKSNNPVIKNLKLTTCYEDFELKKLFFNFIVVLCKNPTALQVKKTQLKSCLFLFFKTKFAFFKLMSESNVMYALFTYVKPVDTARDARNWTVSQFEELQLHAMASLCIIIPCAMKDYFNCSGATHLLLFLEWCTNKKSKRKNFKIC